MRARSLPFPVPSVLLALILVTSTASTAAAGTITGRVVDADGRPVARARVLVSTEGRLLQSVPTDHDGRFTIQESCDAGCTMRIAADGFRAEAVDLASGSAPRDVGTIALSVGAISESVVVSAAQVEVPLTRVTSTVTVIGGAELEARQLHSVADALRTVPGLTVVATGGLGATTGLFPRGGESNFTLVLIDGVPANAFGGDFDFGHLSTANVDRIEIVRGPQSALYGSNAIGAVVRIVTRRGGPPAGRVSVEGGHYGTSRLSAATSGERGAFEWGASFDQLLSDGMNGERTASGATIANDDYERRTGVVSAGWRRDGAWVRGDAHLSTTERGFPGPFGSNPIGVYGGIDTVSRGDDRRGLAALSASMPLSRRVRAQATISHNQLESDFLAPFGASSSFSRRWTGRVQSDIALGPGIDLSAGVELQRERTGSTFITGAAAREIPIARRSAGYFAEARWSSGDRVFVTGGIRVEDIHRDAVEESDDPFSPRPVLPADDVVSANPRLSAAWLVRGNAASYTKVRGAVGSGIRPPDGFELAFTDNPGLKPERSVSWEAGVEQAFAGGRGAIEATTFVNRYDDLLVTVGSFTGASRYQTDNIANASARGLELAVAARGRVRPALEIAGRLGYTLLDTEVLAVDSTTSAPPPFAVGQALLRRPKHQFFVDLSATAGALSLFTRGGGRSRALDVEPSFGTFGGLFDAAGYHVWDAGGAWRLGKFVELFGRIENIFGREYEEAFGFPALGRRATAGLRVAASR